VDVVLEEDVVLDDVVLDDVGVDVVEEVDVVLLVVVDPGGSSSKQNVTWLTESRGEVSPVSEVDSGS
jgi:hypothetical protein